ncbi:MAG: carboxymuconolactone decarboxylase family protein [Quisquiliibacterium sp.]
MHLRTPRIEPLGPDQWNEDQAQAVAPMGERPVLNIFRTMLHNPQALRAFLGWGSYVLSKQNSLPAREREILILRVGYLCRSGYEWTQHRPIGERAGLSAQEIEAIKAGADSAAWSEADRALLRACDELHQRQFISDATWKALGAHLNQRQCMDLVFTVGQYTQVSMLLNTFGVQLDPGQVLDPDLQA